MPLQLLFLLATLSPLTGIENHEIMTLLACTLRLMRKLAMLLAIIVCNDALTVLSRNRRLVRILPFMSYPTFPERWHVLSMILKQPISLTMCPVESDAPKLDTTQLILYQGSYMLSVPRELPSLLSTLPKSVKKFLATRVETESEFAALTRFRYPDRGG
jgi:hypothetical protein